MKTRLLDLFAGPGYTAPATVVHGPNHLGLALASPTPPPAPRITDGIACCDEPDPIEWAQPVQMLWASPRLSPQFSCASPCRATAR